MNNELWDKFINVLPYIVPVVALFLGAYKDTILRKFNIKKEAAEAELTTSDTIDKNLQLYQKLLDDYKDRKEAEDIEQRKRISQLEGRVKEIGEENRRLLKRVTQIDTENAKLRDQNKEIRTEKSDLQETLKILKNQVQRLKNLVGKLQKQLEFYKEHSNLDLPKDLEH